MIIKNERITNQILVYVKEQVESGAWIVGEKVPSENQLSAELGVSRASVRSAYLYLTGLGALKSRQGSGTFLVDGQVENWDLTENRITSEDCRDIQKVLEFRRILEPETCRLAIERCTDEVAPELEACLREMVRNRQNPMKFVQADMEFHKTISRAAGNSLLEKTLLTVLSETRTNHEQINLLVGDDNGIQYHSSILEAFRNRDAQRGYEIMLEHIQSTLRQVQQQYRDSGRQ